jgi:hypothetical protein
VGLDFTERRIERGVGARAKTGHGFDGLTIGVNREMLGRVFSDAAHRSPKQVYKAPILTSGHRSYRDVHTTLQVAEPLQSYIGVLGLDRKRAARVNRRPKSREETPPKGLCAVASSRPSMEKWAVPLAHPGLGRNGPWVSSQSFIPIGGADFSAERAFTTQSERSRPGASEIAVSLASNTAGVSACCPARHQPPGTRLIKLRP